MGLTIQCLFISIRQFLLFLAKNHVDKIVVPEGVFQQCTILVAKFQPARKAREIDFVCPLILSVH